MKSLSIVGRRMPALRWLAIFGVLLGLVASCAPERSRPRKTHLAILPAGYRPGMLAVADEAARHAFVVGSAEGQQVVVDGVAGPMFRQFWPPAFSPVAKRVFHWAVEDAGPADSGVLVADGEVVARGFGKVGKLVFSKDGSRWAVVVGTPSRREGDRAERGPVVVRADGKELGRYPDASYPSFSHDGKHVAYLIEAEDGTVRLVVDGEERKTFEKPQGKCAVAVKRYDVGPNLPPQFRVDYLSDGSLFVLAQDAQGWAVYRDDTRLASYAASQLPEAGLSFSFGDECRTASPVQTSCTSHWVAAGRHTVPVGSRTSAGQVLLTPSQLSATSQVPAHPPR